MVGMRTQDFKFKLINYYNLNKEACNTIIIFETLYHNRSKNVKK